MATPLNSKDGAEKQNASLEDTTPHVKVLDKLELAFKSYECLGFGYSTMVVIDMTNNKLIKYVTDTKFKEIWSKDLPQENLKAEFMLKYLTPTLLVVWAVLS